jgi:hypothetical protein
MLLRVIRVSIIQSFSMFTNGLCLIGLFDRNLSGQTLKFSEDIDLNDAQKVDILLLELSGSGKV